MKNLLIKFLTCFVILSISCVDIPKSKETILSGKWRGQFIIKSEDKSFITEGRKKVVSRNTNYEEDRIYCPFNFEIVPDSVNAALYMIVSNAGERLHFGPIYTGRNIRTGEDTFYIDLAPYASCVKGIYEGGKMKGNYIALDRENYYIPFEASFGLTHRFEKLPDSTVNNLQGQWHFIFSEENDKSYDGIAYLQQSNNVLTGNIRTETGDYRFLEGTVSANRARLSTFDGGHIFLFDMKVNEGRLEGIFYSGHKYNSSFIASRDNAFALKNANTITHIKNKDEPLSFDFYEINGNKISISDQRFKNKNKVIQILGTWCPNCRDEVEFLKTQNQVLTDTNWLVLAIAFERFKEKEKAFLQLERYSKNLSIPYPLFYGGHSSKDSSSQVFNQLNGINAYPTLIILDKNNKLRYTHSGFDGPATVLYDDFANEFINVIKSVSSEK